MALEVGLLGPFWVSMGGEPVDVPAGRLRALLATLALSAGEPVPVDRLATAVWGEDAVVDTRVNLQSNVRRLRRLLGAELVTTRGSGYALEAAPDQVDALRFVRLLDEAAMAPDTLTKGQRLVAALELWRGAPFDGVRSDWLEHTQAARLRERYLAALEHRVDIDLAGGALAGVSVVDLATELGELTARYPLREPLWVRLLVALARSGRQAEALERYEVVRTRLAEELGTDPGPELRRLHADLLAGRPAAVSLTGLRVVPRQLPADVEGFIGRDTSLKALDGLLDREDGLGDRPLVVGVITGTAGVGKTTLAVHWAHRAASRFPDGQLYVNLRGFSPTGSPLAPAEAVRSFLDALRVPSQQLPAGLDAQAGLFRSLLAGRRMLVLLDNARDAAQVVPLLPGTPGCLVLVTSRDQLPGLVAGGAHPVTLDLLSHSEAVELLAHRLSYDRVAAEPEAAAELATRCTGLPLALAIVAARAAGNPILPLAALAGHLRDAGGTLDELEAGDAATSLRSVLSWSCRGLGEPAARLFRLLGLHPGPDVATAAAASLAGVPVRRVRPLLAELTRAHLIAEHTPGRYAFHDLLRAYAAELAHTDDPDTERQAATHRLLDHYLHTAHAADRRLYPHGEQVTLAPARSGVTAETPADQEAALAWFTAEYQVLLAVIRQATRSESHRHTCQLARALFLFQQRRGRWHDRAVTQQLAVDAAARLGDPADQARALCYLARACADLGRFGDAHRYFRDGLDLLEGIGDQVGQAYIHYERNLVYGLEGRTANALGAARDALRLFQEAGDQVGQASALTDIGWHHGRLGNRRQALAVLRQALALHQELGNHTYQAHAWACLAETHAHLGDRAKAIACYRQALALFQVVGDRYGEGSTLAHLAAVHRAVGDPAAAQDAWRRAKDILDDLDLPAADQIRGELHHLDPDKLGRPNGGSQGYVPAGRTDRTAARGPD